MSGAERQVFAAVDIGASSGRVILGRLEGQGVELETVHRFPNGAQPIGGALRWDIHGIFDQVLTGLAAAGERARRNGERIASIGIDTWAVDYGLVEADGSLAQVPYSYRDGRGEAQVERVHALIDPARLYATTGLQYLPFNTIYQLAAEPDLAGKQALLIPDLLAFWLTGQRRTEETNASTTGLFDAAAGEWAPELLAPLGLPQDLFAPLVGPGETIGTLLPEIIRRTGLPAGTPVVAVGSHDTASAVAAVPARTADFAYISSGTWSLVGVELHAPVLTEASRLANFTNERGVDGTIRYLRNVGGLWLLQECLRTWAGESHAPEGHPAGLEDLLDAAARLPAGGPLIDPDASGFIAPGGMPGRIRDAVEAAGGTLGAEPAAVVRCILDSLAAGYARTLAEAVQLSGQPVGTVHIVGGGSQNALLCQLTADATGLPVVAGPVEATAQGNILVQARAAGAVAGGLAELRRLTARSQPTTTYRPRSEWQEPGAAAQPATAGGKP
ncbi:carbohydrate kinase [Zafaria cholistanensis]|uniref:Carbohydrate kinase n=1 Tax=Zafaria cholistanensis TaxID=1682741 RepID=A0A5A7NMV5_9MICC|nr:rhamnulokinase family protein [Zafaria cholistanensis]GER22235.1 carbohydrate kinase [Zafaria cholistanensis]